MEKYTLIGVDGNAFAIMGYVSRAMKRECKSKAEINAYLNDAQRKQTTNKQYTQQTNSPHTKTKR